MNEERNNNVDSQEVKAEVRTAVERGEDIRQDVCDITLRALSQGHLDAKKMNRVARAVMEGASIGAESKGSHIKDALSDAMTGMDEALTKSAEASKLAIEEAAGHLMDFSDHDLKRALDDLLALEDMFLDTVKNVAKGSVETVRNTLNDLAQHARISGTTVGKVATESVETLTRQLEQTLRETVTAGSNSAQKRAAQLSQAAAGILEGIADTLSLSVKVKAIRSSEP